MLLGHMVLNPIEPDFIIAIQDNASYGPVGAVFLMSDHRFNISREVALSQIVLARDRKVEVLEKNTCVQVIQYSLCE